MMLTSSLGKLSYCFYSKGLSFKSFLHVQITHDLYACNTCINRLRPRKVVEGLEKRFRKNSGVIFKKGRKQNVGKIQFSKVR